LKGICIFTYTPSFAHILNIHVTCVCYCIFLKVGKRLIDPNTGNKFDEECPFFVKGIIVRTGHPLGNILLDGSGVHVVGFTIGVRELGPTITLFWVLSFNITSYRFLGY